MLMAGLMVAGLGGSALACDRAVPLVPAPSAAEPTDGPKIDPGPKPPRQRCISPADLEAIRALYAERWVPLPPKRAEGL